MARDEVHAERLDEVDRRLFAHRRVVRERTLHRRWIKRVERGDIDVPGLGCDIGTHVLSSIAELAES